jgi:HEAT repeat protein
VVDASEGRPKAPPLVEQFVRLLVVTNKAVSMYPPTSEIPRDAAVACAEALNATLGELPDLRLTITKTGLLYEEAPIFPGNKGFTDFSSELSLRKLAEARFHAGAHPRDLIAFLTVLQLPPEELEAAGGYEARLWELGVGTITVRELRVTLVETQLTSPAGGDAPAEIGSSAAIEEALSAAMAGREYDVLVLNRLIGDPAAIRDYLQQVYDANATHAALIAVGERFTALAEVASASGEDSQHELYRALAEAIAGLSSKLQRDLLVEHVLPESRRSAALAAVVRQMGAQSVSRVFASGVAAGEIGKDDLVKAIRELVLLSPTERQDIVEMATAAMRDAGLSDADVAEVLEQATPARLTMSPAASPAGPRPADSILTILDIPQGPAGLDQVDPDLLALREEAARGTTDSDVIAAMISLATLDTRPAQFATTMSALEGSLDYLIESGGVEVAADAAVALGECATNPELTPEQRLRVEQAIDRFARPNDIRELARTMRVYPKGSPEYEAARKLLDLLGRAALKPLLETLADEPSMAARKSLVDLLSTMAREHVAQLGACVSDSRWYFVRNVVAILGSTKSSAVLMYLERTLRHPDVRVRRETIRGLSGITDRLATEMLVASLADEDAQNVQLAARYLGESGARGAVPALEAVARGEGRGSRDTGPRVEAIEALGRLGASEALPTLETLAGKRSLLGGGRGKELRASAEAAIAAIKSKEATQ